MLMVIFGAGASYDSVPSRPPRTSRSEYRPPLANDLFSNRPQFVTAMRRFPRCQAIIPYLQQPAEGRPVEQVLEGLQEEAKEYPERHRQLTAIRYYLHFMLWECEQLWDQEIAKGITNYKTLLDQIEHWRSKAGERVCIVTFNYERMLEEALPTVGVTIRDLPDYITNQNYKIIKLHGSVHWGREVDTPMENLPNRNVDDVARELIDRAAELEISQRYRMVTSYPIGKWEEKALFPALAIPVETKRNYECPPEHLEALQHCIPKVTKLLVIGWRGTENNFLGMLAESLRKDVRGIIVVGGGEEGKKTLGRLHQAGISTHDITWVEGGFTDFILRRDAQHVLRS